MEEAGFYTKKVIEHFKNPHNYGKMENYDGLGKVGNIICGDVLWLYIKIGKNTKGIDIIKDISFETFGCVAAISNSSVITDLAKGKTLDKAMVITKDQIIKKLGKIPQIKIHCSLLATDALQEAIFDYLSKNRKPIPKQLLEKHKRIEREKEIIEKKYKIVDK